MSGASKIDEFTKVPLQFSGWSHLKSCAMSDLLRLDVGSVDKELRFQFPS